MAFNGPLPAAHADEVNRILLAERMGWTLDYIDTLDVQEYDRLMLMLDAIDRARAHVREREARTANRKRGRSG